MYWPICGSTWRPAGAKGGRSRNVTRLTPAERAHAQELARWRPRSPGISPAGTQPGGQPRPNHRLRGRRGERRAIKERDALARRMTPAERAHAQELARAWRPRSPGISPAGTPDDEPRSGARPTVGEPGRTSPEPPPPRAIREAQRLLAALGYQPGAIDGIWGQLFAALDIATGKVIGQCFPRHRSREFLKFLRTLETRVPDDLASIW